MNVSSKGKRSPGKACGLIKNRSTCNRKPKRTERDCKWAKKSCHTTSEALKLKKTPGRSPLRVGKRSPGKACDSIKNRSTCNRKPKRNERDCKWAKKSCHTTYEAAKLKKSHSRSPPRAHKAPKQKSPIKSPQRSPKQKKFHVDLKELNMKDLSPHEKAIIKKECSKGNYHKRDYEEAIGFLPIYKEFMNSIAELKSKDGKLIKQKVHEALILYMREIIAEKPLRQYESEMLDTRFEVNRIICLSGHAHCREANQFPSRKMGKLENDFDQLGMHGDHSSQKLIVQLII